MIRLDFQMIIQSGPTVRILVRLFFSALSRSPKRLSYQSRERSSQHYNHPQGE